MGVTKSTSLTTTILVGIILISVNLLGTRFYSRVDLTENKMYTISSSTEGLLKNLDDVVNVKAYFSKELPPYFATLDSEVKNLLDEYKSRSNQNLRVKFIDPSDDPALERTVVGMGIPKVQLNVIEKDKAAVTSAFLGLAIQYAEKTEVIPVVQNVDNLEYDLTAAILKVIGDTKTVGFVFPPGLSLAQGYRGVNQILGRQYALRPVDLSQPVGQDVSTLVVVDHDEIDDLALYHLDQFFMGGGHVLMMASGVQIPSGSLTARNREVKLGKLLKAYGVQVQNALIADARSGMATFSQGFMQVSMAYPWWPQFTGKGLSKEHPATSALDAVILPWVSPVSVTAVTDSSSVQVATLLTSSERSFAQETTYDLNPRVTPRPAGGQFEPQVAAVALTGIFPSYFAGRPAPGDSLGALGPESSLSTQLVVIGNEKFIEDSFLPQFPSNPTFLANVVDWMTLGNDLIGIRSRAGTARPLKEVADKSRGALKWLGILGMPVLVVLGGLGRSRLRKNRRLAIAREYGGRVS